MRINHLSFTFDANEPAFFSNVCVDFEPHRVHFIQGDNGIGKSTLFSILQGTIPSTARVDLSVTLDGQPYNSITQHVQTVQQQYDRMIAPQFTFVENLQLANLKTYPLLQSLPQEQLLTIAQNLSIDLHKPVSLLSGGQRQLLAILMALQKSTKVLLLDEPTATLDRKNAQMIIECLQRIARELKVTMLVICHDHALIQQHTTCWYTIERGANNARTITVCEWRPEIID